MQHLHFICLALVILAVGIPAREEEEILYPTTRINSSSCTTPKGTSGSCINIKSCPSAISLLTQQPLTANNIEYLKRLQCGFEKNTPKVCCEITATTNQDNKPSQPVDDTKVPDVTQHPNLALLDQKRCGPINQDKIFGGNRTRVNEIPWMALLAYDTGRSKPEFRCGASIINKRYILTAAHCVTNLPSHLKLVGVRVGEHDINQERDCDDRGTNEEVCAEKYQDFEIESVKSHEKYSTSTLHNDIAIIRVNRDIDFRPENSKPVCLPIGNAANIKSHSLMVTGWGLTEQRISSPVMLKIKLPIYPQNECAKTYERQTKIWYKQICVGGEKGKDSCSGDSGGPLVGPAVYQGTPRYIQYGIVSFGVKLCGTEGFPGVYTRVDYYLDWILNNMRD